MMDLIKTKYDLPADEADAINLLQNYDIIPRIRWCNKGHEMKMNIGKRNIRWICMKVGCRQTIGIRQGTFFEGNSLIIELKVFYLRLQVASYHL